MTDRDSLITTPPWVSAERPRSVRDWTSASKVYVTTWGDRVHLFVDCPGTKGFGTDPTVTQVPLSNRVCTGRKACRRCFGDFWSGRSIEELNRLIETLHGRIDDGPDRRTRSVIAEKISRRYGGAQDQDRPKDPARLVTSRNDPKKKRSGATKTSSSPRAATPPSKALAKRDRDTAAAAALGITVAELKNRRRAENEAKRGTSKSRKRNGQRRGAWR